MVCGFWRVERKQRRARARAASTLRTDTSMVCEHQEQEGTKC